VFTQCSAFTVKIAVMTVNVYPQTFTPAAADDATFPLKSSTWTRRRRAYGVSPEVKDQSRD
jgi:hypothetical protein